MIEKSFLYVNVLLVSVWTEEIHTENSRGNIYYDEKEMWRFRGKLYVTVKWK